MKLSNLNKLVIFSVLLFSLFSLGNIKQYYIKGNIGIPNVKIEALSRSFVVSTYSDENGNYKFNLPRHWTGYVKVVENPCLKYYGDTNCRWVLYKTSYNNLSKNYIRQNFELKHFQENDFPDPCSTYNVKIICHLP